MFATIAALIFAGILAFAAYFHRRQNGPNAPVGGPISRAKALWLAYTLGAWFLTPLVLVMMPDIHWALRTVLIVHLVSWWGRGPLELVMIYRWLNWSPIYGITHDIVHVMAVMLGASWAAAKVGLAGMTAQPLNGVAFAFLAILVFSTVAEAVFAGLFVGTRDKDATLIYFADESERYKMINRLTVGVCGVTYTHLVTQLACLAVFS